MYLIINEIKALVFNMAKETAVLCRGNEYFVLSTELITKGDLANVKRFFKRLPICLSMNWSVRQFALTVSQLVCPLITELSSRSAIARKQQQQQQTNDDFNVSWGVKIILINASYNKGNDITACNGAP